MPSQFAAAVYPVARRFIGIAKESVFATPVSPTFTLPMTTFQPVDKVTYFEDTAWRNAMAGLYDLIQGPKISDLSMGGPFFADGLGYMLLDILGDYSVSITNPGTTTTLSSQASAGTSSISTAGTLTTGTPVLIYNAGSSGFAEVVTPASGSNPYTLNRPLYYTHSSGATVAPTTGSTVYTHTFYLLNSGTGAGGYSVAQPPTYTFTDSTGVPASTGARTYAATCLSELTFTGTSTALLMWEAKGTALSSAIAGSTPTSTVSTVRTQPSWLSTMTFNATQEFNNIEWKLTISRHLDPKFPNSGQQDPFAIPRGTLTANMAFQFDPAVDESEYLFYLNNTQPTLVLTANNGLAGTSLAGMTVNTVITLDTGQIVDNRTVFGYDVSGPMKATTAQAGPSGGYSPLSVSVTNLVPSY